MSLARTLLLNGVTALEQGKTNMDEPLPIGHKPNGTWVQTERAGHEAWASLTKSHAKAAQLMHVLVANMDAHSAVVASHKVLAQLCGVSVMTIRRSVETLVSKRFIEVVRIGEAGGVLAYHINSRVAWVGKRDNIRYAKFSAMVLASSEEQQQEPEDSPPLVQIPAMFPGEKQLPHDPAGTPDLFGDTLPDLPATRKAK